MMFDWLSYLMAAALCFIAAHVLFAGAGIRDAAGGMLAGVFVILGAIAYLHATGAMIRGITKWHAENRKRKQASAQR